MNHADRYFLALAGLVVAAGSDCPKAIDTPRPPFEPGQQACPQD